MNRYYAEVFIFCEKTCFFIVHAINMSKFRSSGASSTSSKFVATSKIAFISEACQHEFSRLLSAETPRIDSLFLSYENLLTFKILNN